MIKRRSNRLVVFLLLSLWMSIVIVGCGKREEIKSRAASREPRAADYESRITSREPRAAEETEKQVLSADRYGREDPFDPVFARGSEKKADLILEGIVWDSENPKVIINNKIIGIGEQVRGNRVIDIREDRVILNDGTADFELRSGEKR